MNISESLLAAGRNIDAAPELRFTNVVSESLKQFIGWPFALSSGPIRDGAGALSDHFPIVVHLESDKSGAPEVPSNSVAAVVETVVSLDRPSLLSAYAKVASAKRLKKDLPPLPPGTRRETLTIILAKHSSLALEELAAELQALNASTPSSEWPDFVAVSGTGIVNFAVQFPGEYVSGDYFLPEKGLASPKAPPMYVVMVIRPTSDYTFNKTAWFLIGHLAAFSPGSKLPDLTSALERVPQHVVTHRGYQYNLKGDLVPVPPQFYSNRYLAPQPLRIESKSKELLAEISYIPWQDGGVIALRGKLPLDGILPLAGTKTYGASIIRRPNELQLSYVLPMTSSNFAEFLGEFQRRSNMRITQPEQNLVIQKISSQEGAASPFMARLMIGVLSLRDNVFQEFHHRNEFDKQYSFAFSSLTQARDCALAVAEKWNAHLEKVKSGEIAKLDGKVIRIGESIDKELAKEVDAFLNSAVRALKFGMQSLCKHLGVDISFLFKKQPAFEKGIEELRKSDQPLADYLENTRSGWSELLITQRNSIEHEGWTLPRTSYSVGNQGIEAIQPNIAEMTACEFTRFVADRLCCFFEELTVHCLEKKLPLGISIYEIPVMQRDSKSPERFVLTPTQGGHPVWTLSYHESTFEVS